jgi:G3E family GTPase
MLWSQAGGSLKAEPYGRWWASIPMRERAMNPAYMENQDVIMSKWDKKWGDRMNELVIIGQELDKESIKHALNACLVNESDEEAMNSGNVYFEDKWPV